MIELIFVSFTAGILTILAPCILPLLPVILGATSTDNSKRKASALKHQLVILASLCSSIILFTILLKATTTLLGVPTEFWAIISGGILVLLGLSILVPSLWERFVGLTKLQLRANQLMGKSQTARGFKKDIILGASLGPVFNSCSPTYALIVAVILPKSPLTGLVYLLAYVIGLGGILLVISLFGQIITTKLKWLSNPNGIFKKVIGLLFILIGLAIICGIDKKIQTYVLTQGWYDPIMKLEQSINLSH